MASRAKNLASLFSNAKTRTIIIFTVILLLIGIGIGLNGLRKKSIPQAAGASSVAAAPELENIPGVGAKPTPEYLKITKEANQRAYEQALKTGQTSVPTLIGDNVNQQAGNAGSVSGTDRQSQAGDMSDSNAQALESPEQALLRKQQAALAAAKARAAQLAAQQAAESQASQQQQQDDKLAQAMAREAKGLITSWNPTEQAFEQGKEKNQAQAEPGQAATGTTQQMQQGISPSKARPGVKTKSDSSVNQTGADATTGLPQKIKAGTIYYGVLNTAVNSDLPGPVLATILMGPFKGARLVGTLKLSKLSKTVVLSFSTMSLPKQDKSIRIDAVAIDPNTARTALRDKVDNHYLLRYGSLFASSFLQGYGQAIALSNSTNIVTPFGGQVKTFGNINAGEKFAYALGTVGTRLGTALGKTFNRPPTVTVKSGTGVGLLYLEDASLQKQF